MLQALVDLSVFQQCMEGKSAKNYGQYQRNHNEIEYQALIFIDLELIGQQHLLPLNVILLAIDARDLQFH